MQSDFAVTSSVVFFRQFPEYEAYDVPPFFRSDWMNEFWDGQDDSDDYRFVYIGPKGSWYVFK